jgi:hypothetical protein
MIEAQWNNIFPMPLIGIADSTLAQVIVPVMDETGWEVCACTGDCDFEEQQFVHSDGNWWKNDRKSFIRAKVLDTDTITFTLWKDGVQVATLNGTSYGTYYDFGSLVFPQYKGFIIQWSLVKAAFGYGRYKVRTTHVSLGQTYTFDSHSFYVLEYTPERANGTVRIETYQNGSIMNGYDYTGIGWYQSLRISGKFGNKNPKIIQDNYQSSDRSIRTIQSKTEYTYSLVTHLIPAYISNYLNDDAIHSNEIYITDYNLLNQELYRRLPVYVSDIPKVVNHNLSRNSNYVYELKPRQDNTIKLNIGGDFGLLPKPSGVETQFIEDTSIVMKVVFNTGDTDADILIDADSDGSYTLATNDGASGTITFSLDGVSYAAFLSPLVLASSDTLYIKRTISTGDGWVKLTGTQA